ncbi:MAG: hypothetical protein AAFX08_06530 [Pseudomonadota bacterium]
MLRSLAALLVAVFVGLAAAKVVESVGFLAFDLPAISEQAGGSGDGRAPGKPVVSSAAAGVLALSWLVAAFVATALALLIGRRWAPLGWLAAATIGFNAIVSLLGASAPFWIWPAGLAASAAGGLAAVKGFRARRAYPTPQVKDGFFE